ncbi:undecaprenyldiphospho-muramoylpentapeptide beta-N-acetylglucosaminyltransferase [Vagococcus xieshaowenii]|uniref:UDP-N-acetylglucosamine--N-acetylmuramyl-(pentapeptide) pyrophosphoryl-undecaprenol N-acetylglucosamine transferase n=1 Tax=Vagococcus xieshaowenii TaxID=2562451 RepID=A0AAJ5EGN3_9ENTE|nr:undecaprenyldiphospho-muramoylpentapeptide beta-N-acetylglucosaminyltransferase [Vagococcus xieshaowenii]QCA28989.1 undecaprenyldiphospho-muramoylpentapeptide beta-N-acetylglucosaminyltransferase [Vagococcus xieshaowenii]TFZ43170.1 undecaprenyldiphospho-muramoylpentapeptide beta-N-acetylglucosaminyltransferase [Vagococcus xieshaowenii]
MRLLVSGGGTGGHVYPALSLVKYVKEVEPDSTFMYVGTQGGLESTIVKNEYLPFASVDIQGFRRKLTFENVTTIKKFLKSIKDSKRIIKEFQPDVVVGTGGYVCAPVVYAAHKLGIPTLIHEQNSVPGVANKFLSRYVDKVAVCFEDAIEYFPKEKVELTGNPRAQEVAGLKPDNYLTDTYQLDSNKKTVLLFGGSRGAKTMMNAVEEAVNELEKKDYQTIVATGNIYFESISEHIDLSSLKMVKIVPYIDNMTQVLANIDLVVSRAGATSIAEFTGMGLPSILIPSPNVTNDHQTKNAMSLVRVGAAEILKDSELTGQTLVSSIDAIMKDEERLKNMAVESEKIGYQDATTHLYQLLKALQK